MVDGAETVEEEEEIAAEEEIVAEVEENVAEEGEEREKVKSTQSRQGHKA